jgi:hypothetical protein
MSTPVCKIVLAAMVMSATSFVTQARAEDMLFPPATEGCYVGTEITPAGAKVEPTRKPAVPVTAIRLIRAYPQLWEEERDNDSRPHDGGRFINLQVNVTFADAGKGGLPKRFVNGRFDLLRCTADVCDANNYKVERQGDGSVLLRMTGGMNIGGGIYRDDVEQRLPDGHLYRLTPSPMEACR